MIKKIENFMKYGKTYIPSIEQDKLYWDERLKTYDKEVTNKETKDATVEYLKRTLTRLDPDTVLEIGYGTGKILKLCSEVIPHADLTGIDQSDTGKETAQRKAPEAVLLHGSGSELGFKDKEFDVVLLIFVLLHNKEPARTMLLNEAWRVGKKVVVVDSVIHGTEVIGSHGASGIVIE